jgi:RimJ/RimL family protein N-acetyltransferase
MNAPSQTLPTAVLGSSHRVAQWLRRAIPSGCVHRVDDRQGVQNAHVNTQTPGWPRDSELDNSRTRRSDRFPPAPDAVGTARSAAVACRAEAPSAPRHWRAVAPEGRRHALLVPDAQAGLAGVMVRVAQPSDIIALQQLYASLSMQTRAQRFFVPLPELPRQMVNALESDDPAHRFLVVERPDGHGNGTLLGLGQYVVEPGQARCEVALLIADEWQGLGLGTRLLGRLLEDAMAAGLREARLETLHGNLAMRALARRAGFRIRTHPEDPMLLLGSLALARQHPHLSVGQETVALGNDEWPADRR